MAFCSRLRSSLMYQHLWGYLRVHLPLNASTFSFPPSVLASSFPALHSTHCIVGTYKRSVALSWTAVCSQLLEKLLLASFSFFVLLTLVPSTCLISGSPQALIICSLTSFICPQRQWVLNGWSCTLERGVLGAYCWMIQHLGSTADSHVSGTEDKNASLRPLYLTASEFPPGRHLSREATTMSHRNSKYWGHGLIEAEFLGAFFKKNWNFSLLIVPRTVHWCKKAHRWLQWLSLCLSCQDKKTESVFMAVSLVLTPLGKLRTTSLYLRWRMPEHLLSKSLLFYSKLYVVFLLCEFKFVQCIF